MGCYDPPFFLPLCLLLFTHVASRICTATSFLLDSFITYFIPTCPCTATGASLSFIFTPPAAEPSMTLYDSLFTVVYSAPAHSWSSFILYLSTPFCTCVSLPFSLFYLSILNSFLPAPYSFYTVPYSCFTSIFYSIHVYSIAYMYLVWLGCKLVIYKGAVMSLEG